MQLARFVRVAWDSGRVIVARPSDTAGAEGDATALNEELKLCDEVTRANLAQQGAAHGPRQLPAFLPAVAHWAARLTYRAAQALVYREIAAEQVDEFLSEPCPAGDADSPVTVGLPTTATVYSADIMLRFLPDLYRLARKVASADPLAQALVRLGRAWPLSSVGMPEIASGDDLNIDFLDDLSLRQLYVDRILQYQDSDRLSSPRVRWAVRESLGAYPSLEPKIERFLREHPEEPNPQTESQARADDPDAD